MREILTALGVLLIVALIGAMGAPYFIDWGRHRPLIEERLSLIAGQPVRIDGPIAVTLLPTPSLSLDQVKLGSLEGEQKPLLAAERLQAALSATALLRGDIHFTEVIVDAPVIHVRPEGIVLPAAHEATAGGFGSPETVSIEKLIVRDGSLVVTRPGKEAMVFSAIGGEFDVSSLVGPAKGNASFAFEGNRRLLRFSLGKVEKGLARLKALAEDPQTAVRIDIDGVAAFNPAAGKMFDGAVHLTANPALGGDDKLQLPINANAKLKVAGGLATLDEIALTIGPEPQPAAFAGAGKVEIAARPIYDITLSARSFDFDRPGPDGKPRHAIPADLIRRAIDLVPTPLRPIDIEGRAEIAVGALIMGGQTVMAPKVVLRQSPTGVRIEMLSAEVPGQSQVAFTREAQSDEGLLAGSVAFESRDPERLHGWFNGIPRVLTAHATLKATARLSSLKDGVQIDRIEMDRGSTHLSGSGSYLLPARGVRPVPHLTLKLTSPRFDVADIPAFVIAGDKADEKPDLDFVVDIAAERLAFEGNETGRLVFKARRDGEITSIDRIAVTEFGGANLIASGALGGGARRITFKLDAARGEAIAGLAEQVFPGPLTAGLRKRAALLAPALIVASLANDVSGDSYALSAEGKMAGTEIKANGKVIAKADIDIDLSVLAQNPDGARLAQQIGAGRTLASSPLPGSLDVKVKGNPRASMAVAIKGGLSGTAAEVAGTIKLFQPFSPFEGTISARSMDVAPLLQAIGLSGIDLSAGSGATLNARLASNLQQLTFTDIRAQIAGSPVTGELAFRLTEGGKVAGQIKTPSFDLRPVIGLAFGPLRSIYGAKGWATEPFQPSLTTPLFGDLWVETERAQLDDTLRLTDARFVLRFDENAGSIEYADVRLGGVRAQGDVFVKRSGESAYVSAKLRVDEADIAKLWPQGASGKASGDLLVSGSGPSVLKVIQSLAGSATVAIEGASIPAFASQAMARLTAIPPEQMGAVDAGTITRRLEAELARQPLVLGDVALPLVVIDGVVRLAGLSRTVDGVRHDFSGTFDLGQLLLDLRAVSTMGATPEGWRGAPPQFATQWRGTLDSIRRALSVEVLVNGYLAWSLQRELEKAEIQDQDMRERAFFNRRYRAAEEEKRRAAEAIAAERAQQAEQLRLRVLEENQRKQQQLAPLDAPASLQPVAPRMPPPPLGLPLDLTPPPLRP